MRAALTLLIITFSAQTFAATSDCVSLLISPPQNPEVAKITTGLISDYSTGKKVFALGSLAEMKLMMQALGYPRRTIERNGNAISALFALSTREPILRGTTLARVVRKLYGVMNDSSSVMLCLLGPKCDFSIGKDAHIFLSNTVHVRPTGENKNGSLSFETKYSFAGLPDPFHIIVIHHKSVTSGTVLASFFHEGSHFEVSSLLFSWVKRNESQILRGERSGLFANFHKVSNGIIVDEGFATTVFESQAHLVEGDMEKLLEKNRDVEWLHAHKLIAELDEIPPAAEFLKMNGLNELNIFDWSRQTIEKMIPPD